MSPVYPGGKKSLIVTIMFHLELQTKFKNYTNFEEMDLFKK